MDLEKIDSVMNECEGMMLRYLDQDMWCSHGYISRSYLCVRTSNSYFEYMFQIRTIHMQKFERDKYNICMFKCKFARKMIEADKCMLCIPCNIFLIHIKCARYV